MAEGVLFTIADRILGKLISLASQEIGLCWGVKDEIVKLKNTVSSIRSLLIDAEKKQAHSEQVKDWLGKLKQVVYEVDELLDDFSTEALRQQVMNGNKLTKMVRVFFSPSNQFVYGLKMGHKIKIIREKLAAIENDRKFELEMDMKEDEETKMRKQTDSSPPETVIGRKDDKMGIIEQLLASNYNENVSVISIVGIGGLGKTTLAQIIYNDEKVESHFELKLWICVSYTFDVKVIVKKMLESVTKQEQDDLELDTLKCELERNIRGRKFLLVLDDIWNENRESWDNLKKFLVGGAAGSKVMITTRSMKVAEVTDTLPSYFLKGLSTSDSWSLFMQIVFKGREPTDRRSIKIGKQILEKCVGVPLAIKTVGSLLYFKDPETEWWSFMDEELSKIDRNENYILRTLKLSYDHLPSHLKQCFAFCSLFPKGYDIEVNELIQLWIAQGFVKPSISNHCLEDIGNGYFKDLVWRSFLQEVMEKDIVKDRIVCKMHDLMHDLAVLVAGTETAVSDFNGESIHGNVRHVSFYVDSSEVEYTGKIPASLLRARNVRTFLPLSKWNFEAGQLNAIFCSLRCLLALDLSGMGIKTIPNSLGMLKYLRSLNLSCNSELEALPNSITQLQNLEVLDLSGCTSLKELPREIKKFVRLKNLDCEYCISLTHMPRGLGQLTSLEKLTKFLVAKEGSISRHIGGLNELNKLNNLRGKLEIRGIGCKKVEIGEFEAANLKEKRHLQSLLLHWNTSTADNNNNNNNADYDLNSLQNLRPHRNLQKLYVHGYGGVKFPNWFRSLTNLVHIMISQCSRCQHLPRFDSIPSLKELWLRDLSDLEYIDGEENVRDRGGEMFFPSLKKLLLINCPNLMAWWKKRDSDENGVVKEPPQFPCLSFLHIQNCPKLTWMPLFPTLDDSLLLMEASLEPLHQTMKTKMVTSVSSSSSSSSLVPPLSNLKNFLIGDVVELESFSEN